MFRNVQWGNLSESGRETDSRCRRKIRKRGKKVKGRRRYARSVSLSLPYFSVREGKKYI